MSIDNPQAPKPVNLSGRKVIFINGPPGVGKDTAAGAIMVFIHRNASWTNPRHLKIADPIKRATHILFGVAHLNNDYYDAPSERKKKEIPTNDFFGYTPRHAYIEVATMVREKIGVDHFGWLARREMFKCQSTQVYVFSDCGFADELGPIVDAVGAKNVLVLELSSTGLDFSKDSRSYVGSALQEKYPEITVRRLVNDMGDTQDKELFKVYCMGIAKSFLKIEDGTEGDI